MGLMSKFEPP
ncbi:hypothetical protein LINPERPRIM_LOCUS37609 [Linum perenne]